MPPKPTLVVFCWCLFALWLAPFSHAAPVQAALRVEGPWKAYATRTVSDLPRGCLKYAPQDYSVYGGLKTVRTNATGFFYPARIQGRWWLVDPEGCLFIHKGVASVRPLNSAGAKAACRQEFGSEEAWANHAALLLKSNGFNALGAWSDSTQLRAASPRVVYTEIWNFMSAYGKKRGGTFQQPGHTGYPGDAIFVFDPDFETFCEEHARQLAATKDDPWLLGHFSDNELPLSRAALTNFLSLPERDPGHAAALKFLRDRHGPTGGMKDIGPSDVEAFLELVAERYFRIVSAAIKKRDPHHLYLGCRFHGAVPRLPEVFRAAGRYVDVISVNLYRIWTPAQDQLSAWERASGRPVMITEWYAKGMDSGMGNTSGAGWVVRTQADRGRFYQNFTLALLESRSCVGWDWFKYIDNDPQAAADPSNTDSNKGIVNNRYVPYAPLLESMKQLNDQAYGIARYFNGHRPAAQSAASPRN